MKRTFAILASAAAFGSIGFGALAQDMSAEETFFALRQAVVAYERCNDIELSQDEAFAVDQRIQELTGEDFGAGSKLMMIEEARAETAMRVTTRGCNDEEIEQHLTRFEADLAPALSMAAN